MSDECDTHGLCHFDCNNIYQKVVDECTDFNECELDIYSCDKNTSCNNTDGSYTCESGDEYRRWLGML